MALALGTVGIAMHARTCSGSAGAYTLDISGAGAPVLRDHLDLGGTRADGSSFAVTSTFIERNGRPIVPIVGEIHFARTPAAEWEESLRRIHAGGVTVVATYVFWNLHERQEGTFDWSGDLDLRRFVQLAQKVGLDVILRIGPFCHGEIRNGGLPDWIYGKPFEVRSNDPGYLACAGRLYAEIAGQVRGLLFNDGGPIIGIQLENEFQHSAAPWNIRYAGAPITWTVAERDVAVTHGGVSVSETENANAGYGNDHMVNLKWIAQRCGLVAPLYTATGWGNAAIVPGGSIPVTAAYAYPFWTHEAKPSPFYLFKDIRREPDYQPVSFDTSLYPSIPAEMGAGICMTYARRSYVPERSIVPMVVRMLGSGSNGVGYYMYHGGATPRFDGVFYNEDASGLPKINYDYQAPLGQYGRAKAHYFSLRPIHLFLQSFGDRLAPLPCVLPATNSSIVPADTGTLRFAARAARGAGFLTLLNFQDHAELRDLTGLELSIHDGRRIVRVPEQGTMTLKANVAAILPINLDLEGVPLRSATVQPLSILRNRAGTRFVFAAIEGMEPELVFDQGTVGDAENCSVSSHEGGIVVRGRTEKCFSFTIEGRPILVVPHAMAEQAVPVAGGRLLFAAGTVTTDGDEVTLLSEGANTVDVHLYPGAPQAPAVRGAGAETIAPPVRAMSALRLRFPTVNYRAEWRQVAPRRYEARFSQDLDGLNDVFMHVNYVGDTGMAFIDGRMVDDHFYSGRPWEIALRRFLPRLRGSGMVFVFQPMYAQATYLADLPKEFRPDFGPQEKSRLEVEGPEFIPQYRALLTLPSVPPDEVPAAPHP